jgi:hypothetical protein
MVEVVRSAVLKMNSSASPSVNRRKRRDVLNMRQ